MWKVEIKSVDGKVHKYLVTNEQLDLLHLLCNKNLLQHRDWSADRCMLYNTKLNGYEVVPRYCDYLIMNGGRL